MYLIQSQNATLICLYDFLSETTAFEIKMSVSAQMWSFYLQTVLPLRQEIFFTFILNYNINNVSVLLHILCCSLEQTFLLLRNVAFRIMCFRCFMVFGNNFLQNGSWGVHLHLHWLYLIIKRHDCHSKCVCLSTEKRINFRITDCSI